MKEKSTGFVVIRHNKIGDEDADEDGMNQIAQLLVVHGQKSVQHFLINLHVQKLLSDDSKAVYADL